MSHVEVIGFTKTVVFEKSRVMINTLFDIWIMFPYGSGHETGAVLLPGLASIDS